MTQHDLDDALHRLASGVTPPVVPVADDLARGRRRRRRTHLALAAGAAAAVAVVGLGTAVVPDLVGAGGDPAPGPQTSLPSQTPTTAETAGPEVREIRPSAGPGGVMDFPDMADIRNDPDLNRYRDVLAEHLDPQGEHLEKSVSNSQSGGGSKGTKLAWTNDGETGMGMVQVTVSAGWNNLMVWDCGADHAGQQGWDCHDIPAPRGLTATVAEHDGVTEVAVEHEDGIVVVLTVDALFGNNSTVPVSGIDLGDDLLARAAADPRLDLPGYEDGVPPLLDQQQLAKVGRQVLVADGEGFEVDYTGLDSEPWVQGAWSQGATGGTLSWGSVVAGDEGVYSCSKQQYVRCAVHTVEGREILVGDLRERWGGGWQVMYAGASYEVQVMFDPASDQAEFPLERAFAFVTDPRWQPTR